MPEQKPGRSKQDYATPMNFIEATKRRLGIKEFTVDIAADSGNAKASRYIDYAENAFSHPNLAELTGDGWGWLNPPFSQIAPWARKCLVTAEHGGKVAFLVPAGVGANWYRDFIHRKALVLALNGRLAFMPDKPTWLYPKDCILCLYGPTIEPDFDVWTWRK